MSNKHFRLKPLLFGCLLLLLIVFGTLSWFQNSAPSKADFLTLDHTESIDTVHQKFGLPQRTLSGFWGDVYMMEDGTEVIIYYDDNGFVSQVKENHPDS